MPRRILSTFFLLPVALALCVSLSVAQTGITRIEQTDPSVSFGGNWYTNGSTANSGGSAALTNSAGSRATIRFTGTGISWIGVGDPWSGFARVYLDDTLYRVSTYNNDTRYQQTLFVVRGLASGSHTLSIEVTHERDVNSQGSWVWIDGFDIENGSGVTGGNTVGPGRSEQKNPAMMYTGTWYTNTNTGHSGGSAALAMDAGSSATISFNGSGITWIGYRDEWSGIANVYVDGVPLRGVDAYLSPGSARQVIHQINGLTAGNHTLTIEATGKHNQISGGAWIWIDAFDVTP